MSMYINTYVYIYICCACRIKLINKLETLADELHLWLCVTFCDCHVL
jgi:hypothetical protein